MVKRIKQHATPNLNQAMTPELLGQAIRARRTQSCLRLADAAALCGVAKQTLMNIEHGQTTSQLGSILQICTGLGIQLAKSAHQMKESKYDETINARHKHTSWN